MITCTTLIRCGHLITQDNARNVYTDGGLAILDGEVLAAGSWEEVSRGYAPENPDGYLDGSGWLVLPGLVNAHTHSPMTLLRGLGDDMEVMTWLTTRIWPLESRLTPELINLGARLACLEMLASGTTCFHDAYFHTKAVAEAVVATGIRAVLAEGLMAHPTPSYQTIEEAHAYIRDLAGEYAGSGLVRVGVFPHAAYTTNEEILRGGLALAEELNAPFGLHAAESPAETAQVLAQYGKRPIELLRDLDLLGPRTALAHCVDVTPEEAAFLAETGTHVIHCPRSNAKLASGTAPVREYLKQGVRLSLGTDGAASNNGLNLFAEMAFAAQIAKVAGYPATEPDPTVFTAQEVLDGATTGSAAALGWPELGVLAPGHPADLCALDLTRPNLRPCHSPVSQAVYAASGADVALTMVGGKIVYQDGSFPGQDLEGLLTELDAVRAWVREA